MLQSVTNFAPAEIGVEVSFTLTGSATNGTDYHDGTSMAVATSVFFMMGESSKTITIQPLNDALIEGSESVVLTLRSAAGYDIDPAAGSATITIADAPLPTVSITASDADASEVVTSGQADNLGQFTITRTGDLSQSLTVNLTIGGTATNGTDYYDGTSMPISSTVEFLMGESTKTITVQPLNDGLIEGSETVVLTIDSGSGYTVENGTATVTIADAPIPTVSIAATDPDASEVVLPGQADNLGQFTITRTGDLSQSLTVNLTIGGTATNGTDYYDSTSMPISSTIEFLMGESTKTITVQPLSDNEVEDTESVVVSIASGYGYTAENSSATVTIANVPPGPELPPEGTYSLALNWQPSDLSIGFQPAENNGRAMVVLLDTLDFGVVLPASADASDFTIRLESESGSECIRLWTNPDRTQEVHFGTTYRLAGEPGPDLLPPIVFVEPIAPGGAEISAFLEGPDGTQRAESRAHRVIYKISAGLKELIEKTHAAEGIDDLFDAAAEEAVDVPIRAFLAEQDNQIAAARTAYGENSPFVLGLIAVRNQTAGALRDELKGQIEQSMRQSTSESLDMMFSGEGVLQDSLREPLLLLFQRDNAAPPANGGDGDGGGIGNLVQFTVKPHVSLRSDFARDLWNEVVPEKWTRC